MPTAAHQPKKPAWLATLIAALMAGVFLIDLATPLGVADGIAYLVPVLLTSWLRHRRSTLVVATVCTGLALLGFFLSPPGVGLALALTNRFLAFLGIWVVAGLSLARKGVEEELRRVNRTLRVLSECNQVLVRAREETELLEQVCRLLVEEGGYRLAWVGYAEQDENKAVRPVAQAGFDEGYVAL
ncbi:MAG TPA: hypothetical protein VJ085_05105, partial [Candidatus Acidoferrales bacterium]|nr:hypothetical protein [Candidatus Acidoferrales bacterium]